MGRPRGPTAPDNNRAKKAGEETVASSLPLQSVLDGISEPIMVIGLDRKVSLINRAALEFTGCGPTGVPLYCHEISHRSGGPCQVVICPLEEVKKTGKPVTVVHEHYKGEGGRRYVEIMASPLLDEAGALAGVVESMRDVTERKRADDELKEREIFLKNILDSIQDGISILDRDLNVIRANRAMEETYSYAQAVIGRERQEAHIGGEGGPSARAVESGKPDHDVRLITRPDGAEVWLDLSTFPLVDFRTGRTSGVITHLRDITERKRTEDALRESEEKFRSLAEQSPNMIFISMGGRVIYANRMCEGALGYRKREFYAPGFDCLSLVAPEHRDAFARGMEKSAAGADVKPVEAAFVAKGGRRLDTIVALKAISYDGERAVLGIVTDITERKLLEESLQRYTAELEKYTAEVMAAQEALKASLKEKDLLMREIHHRVKNNLLVISSLLALQFASVKDEEARGALKETQNRVRSMQMVHERLMGSADLRKVDFSEYIRSLAMQLFRSYEATGARVGLAIKVPDVTLDIDTVVPCALILNELVSNSLKHAFPGERKGEIRIEFTSDGGTYVLSVKDDGLGLPPGLDIEQAQTLGLQLVASLTKQLGGDLEVIREGGAEFRVTFREKGYPNRDKRQET